MEPVCTKSSNGNDKSKRGMPNTGRHGPERMKLLSGVVGSRCTRSGKGKLGPKCAVPDANNVKPKYKSDLDEIVNPKLAESSRDVEKSRRAVPKAGGGGSGRMKLRERRLDPRFKGSSISSIDSERTTP